jgi:hypothetical protein
MGNTCECVKSEDKATGKVKSDRNIIDIREPKKKGSKKK